MARRLQVDVGGRLAARHLLAGDDGGEALAQAHERQHALDHLAVRRGGKAERPALGARPHGLDRAVDDREVRAVRVEQAGDDLGVDVLRIERDPDLVVHVARPLGRAHAEHRFRRVRRPGPAVRGGEHAAGGVPGLLGIDEHAVEVEHDRGGARGAHVFADSLGAGAGAGAKS